MTSPSGRVRLNELGRFLEIQNLGLNLPFLLAFLFIASGGWPSPRVTVLVLVAFVAARNAGHSFNRWADRRYDAANPRTSHRALVTGRLSSRFALGLSAAMVSVLVVCAYLLNPLALILTPLAIGLVLGYSFTKRYTPLTTSFLGLVEAITPAASFVAVTSTLPWVSLLAVGALLLWGTAFETVHSVGDVEMDQTLGLRSIPASIGVETSLRLIPGLHASALILFAIFGIVLGLPLPYYVGLVAMAGLVAYSDSLVARNPKNVVRPFRLHFLLSAVYLLGVLAAVLS